MTLNAPPPNGGIPPQTARSKNVDGLYSTNPYVQQNRSTDDVDREPPHKPRYPHVKDLQARANAVIRELSVVMPVCSTWYISSRLDQDKMLPSTSNPRYTTDSYPVGSCKTSGKSSQHQCFFQEAGSCIYGVPCQLRDIVRPYSQT